MSSDIKYGPPRSEPTEQDYTNFRTPKYLKGHAHKIIHDLKRVARLYNGRLVRIFDNGGTSKCTTCTDTITGNIVLKNCPTCGGTGRGKRTLVGEYWVLFDVGPKYKIPTEFGNSENPGGVKETFTVVDAPLLRDEWLIVTVDTREVYKIFDVTPHIVAMQGVVVTQLAACARIPKGSAEHGVITW